jgi:hypothetical protein
MTFAEEIERLPAGHEARKNPDLIVERNVIEVLDLPRFTQIKNQIGVIFGGQVPVMREEEVEEVV